jgi:hypothetical protein
VRDEHEVKTIHRYRMLSGWREEQRRGSRVVAPERGFTGGIGEDKVLVATDPFSSSILHVPLAGFKTAISCTSLSFKTIPVLQTHPPPPPLTLL